MAFVPDEARSYRVHFAVLALLFAAVTAWAVVDEVRVRRPWKVYQARWRELRPGAGAVEGIQQIVVPALSVIDRCPTCHVGILDPQAKDRGLPDVLRAHPHLERLQRTHPPRRFGCTPCHGGQGIALTEGSAHGETDKSWKVPLRRGPLVQSACLRCHADRPHLAGAELLNEGKKLFVGLGCAACHDDGHHPHRRHAPSLRHARVQFHPAGLVAAIATPDHDRAVVQMPSFWPGAGRDPAAARRRDAESTAIAAYLLSRAAPLPVAATVALAGAEPERGRELFDSVGCRGCHEVGIQGLDDLRIRDQPEATAAPDDAWGALGGEDGFGADEEADAGAGPVKAPAAATRTLAPIRFGPPMAKLRAHVRAGFLAAWIRDPHRLWSRANMPGLRLAPRESADVAAWITSLGPPPAATPSALSGALDPDLIDRGRFLIGRYGCAGCHEIPGFEQDGRPGPGLADFGRKDRRDLYFGAHPPPREQRTLAHYAEIKVRDPRRFASADIEQYMPRYRLEPREVTALEVYLLGLRTVTTPADYLENKPAVPTRAAALDLIEGRGCRGCHRLDGRPGDIERYYLAPHLAPPPLDPVGERLQPAWMFGFLLHPRAVRPWLKLRMPSFGFTAAQARALTLYFAARAKKAAPLRDLRRGPITAGRARLGAELFAKMQCVRCHVLTAGGKASVAELAPDLALARERLDPDWVRRFLRDPGAILPGSAMPQFFPGGTTAFPEILGGDARGQIDLLVDYLMNLGVQPMREGP